MDTRWIDPEIEGILEGDPELIELANRVRAARPEPPLDPRFQAVLRAQLMREAPAALGGAAKPEQARTASGPPDHPPAPHRLVAALAALRLGWRRSRRRTGGRRRVHGGAHAAAGPSGHRSVAGRRLPRGEPEQRHHRRVQRADEPGGRRRWPAHPAGHPGDHLVAGEQPGDHPHPSPRGQHAVHGDHRPQRHAFGRWVSGRQ